MKTVIIESPLAGDVATNEAYARRAMKDALSRGEAPFASHLLYTQALDDNVQEERDLGIWAGLAIGRKLDKTVVYADYGVSKGMLRGIASARVRGRLVEYRRIGQNPED